MALGPYQTTQDTTSDRSLLEGKLMEGKVVSLQDYKRIDEFRMSWRDRQREMIMS